MRGFIGGFVAALIILAVVVLTAVLTGKVPARADGALLPGEKWAARTSLRATVRREAPQPPYPFGPPTDQDVATGATLYVQNCSACHGTAHTTANAIARGLGVQAPQFNKHGVDDDPEGETYWKIEHGIRFTGMPAYDKSLDEKSIWQLTYFMKKLPKDLPPAAKSIWENPGQVPPPTPIPSVAPVPKAAAAS
jgi:thiosulfate dehydrogenase